MEKVEVFKDSKGNLFENERVTNLTENSHISPYGIYGVVKNQVLTGYGVIKNDILYVTWSIGGCTMLNIDKALEFGFIINEL